jgi:hypothetical protein
MTLIEIRRNNRLLSLEERLEQKKRHLVQTHRLFGLLLFLVSVVVILLI